MGMSKVYEETTYIGFAIPTLEGIQTIYDLDVNEYCATAASNNDTGENVSMEVYAPFHLSKGELADVKEEIVTKFGTLAMNYDLTERIGYLPIASEAFKGATWVGVGAASKDAGQYLGAAQNFFKAYTNYMALNKAENEKPIAQNAALNFDVYQGSREELAEKVNELGKTYLDAHGTEAEIYETLMDKARDLELDLAAAVYEHKLVSASRGEHQIEREQKPFFSGIFEGLFGGGEAVGPNTVERDPNHPRDTRSNVREIPGFILPVKDGYEIHINETSEMYYLIADRPDIAVELNLRAPEGFHHDDMEGLQETIVNHLYDTVYMENKMSLLMEEAMKLKGDFFSRVISDVIGAYNIYKGVKGLFTKPETDENGEPVPRENPLKQIASGIHSIVDAEYFNRQTNKKAAEQLRDMINSVDDFHQRIDGIVLSEHRGLTHLDTIMASYDTAEKAYCKAFHDVDDVNLSAFKPMFYQKALAEQWDIGGQSKPVATIGRRS